MDGIGSALPPAAYNAAESTAHASLLTRPTLGLRVRLLYGLGEISNSIKTYSFGIFLLFFYTTILWLPGTLVVAVVERLPVALADGPAVDATVWLLLAVFLAVAVVDWGAVHVRSKALEYVCKPGCMLALIAAAAALDTDDEAARTALLVALALSTLGAVFLMLRGERSDLFLAGLASFLCAHIAYVVAFSFEGLHTTGVLVGVGFAAALALFVGRPVVAAVRGGDEPAMAGPVTAYVAVIATMVLAATGTEDGRAAVGALLFAASDSLIARQRFVREAAWAPLAIIVTYHLAQALLVTSFAQG